MKPFRSPIAGFCLAALGCSTTAPVRIQYQEIDSIPGLVVEQPGHGRLTAAALDDDLIHVEMVEIALANPGTAMVTSPMVARTAYTGPSAFIETDGGFETAHNRVEVDAGSLCVTVFAKQSGDQLSRVCPHNLDQDWKGLTLHPSGADNAYGLGEQFLQLGSSEGDWVGRSRTPGEIHGNAMVGFAGGAVGNAQFPVLYAAGEDKNVGLFLDNVYRQEWRFESEPWTVDMWGDHIRFFVMTGPDLPDLRADFMELVGRPPVPPKQTLGLWVSEYGFDSWAELHDKLKTLRQNHFPIDGFVMDLQWFGGVAQNSTVSPMGSLTWDETNFPDPAGEIVRLADQEGLGLMVIEESYISRDLPEHAAMAAHLVTDCESGQPTFQSQWWGAGGMLNWADFAGAAKWHDLKRQPLIDAGIVGHWTDLGEPEMYAPNSCYGTAIKKPPG